MTRSFVLPAGCYLAFALGVPLLNGAHANATFWKHAAVVLTVVALAGVLRQMGQLR